MWSTEPRCVVRSRFNLRLFAAASCCCPVFAGDRRPSPCFRPWRPASSARCQRLSPSLAYRGKQSCPRCTSASCGCVCVSPAQRLFAAPPKIPPIALRRLGTSPHSLPSNRTPRHTSCLRSSPFPSSHCRILSVFISADRRFLDFVYRHQFPLPATASPSLHTSRTPVSLPTRLRRWSCGDRPTPPWLPARPTSSASTTGSARRLERVHLVSSSKAPTC